MVSYIAMSGCQGLVHKAGSAQFESYTHYKQI